MMSDADATTSVNHITSMLIKGQIAEAQQHFASLTDQLPEQFRLECAGNIEFYRRNLQKAVDYYEAAIKLDPNLAIARHRYIVATQEESKGNQDEAIKWYSAAIDADPSFIDAYVDLGGILAKRGQYEIAAQCYRDAVRLEPEEARNHFNLVAVLSKLAPKKPHLYANELTNATKALREIEKNSDLGDLGPHSW